MTQKIVYIKRKKIFGATISHMFTTPGWSHSTAQFANRMVGGLKMVSKIDIRQILQWPVL